MGRCRVAVVSVALALSAGALSAQPVLAQEGSVPSARRTSASQVAEGTLTAASWRDPATWGLAGVITGFVQSEPFEGSPASERTEVRVAFDREAIYVGAWLYDSQPNEIIVGEQRRDANLTRFDAFLLILDTYNDRENGFVFATNPGGIEHDGQVIDEGRQTGRGGGARGAREWRTSAGRRPRGLQPELGWELDGVDRPG